MSFTLAMGQMLVEGGRPEENLARAEAMIARAGRQGCAFIVLPECLDLGWTHPSARTMAEPIPGPRTDRLVAAARAAGIHVVAGLTERSHHRVFNSAVLIAPDGTILSRHRKINELTIGQDLYATGDSLSVIETPHGVVGIDICADNFANSLVFAHSLARMGAQFILSPSAWAVPADHDERTQPCTLLWIDSYSTLARLYDITVVGVSNVGWLTAGPWQGRKCIGYSLAMGPGGYVLARGPYGHDAEALVTVEIEPKPPIARGTDMADALATRGYTGP